MLWCDMFLLCSLLIQDGFSEVQWKEVEEAAANAKVRGVVLRFDVSSRQRARTVRTTNEGMAKNKFIKRIELWSVPEEMEKSVKQTLKTVTDVYVN